MEVKFSIYTEQKNLIAVKNLKELLNQIDHEVELVPYDNKEKLSRLLISLKGQALDERENQLLDSIVKRKIEKEKEKVSSLK